jgi:4'-phosphopantetheinyl transferase
MEQIPVGGGLIPPSGMEIDVWWAHVEVGKFDPQLRMALAADIDAPRLAKLDRFRRVEDRDRGLAAHALLRRLLVAIIGGAASDVVLHTRCASCGKTDHGKPYLATGSARRPVEMNISHSGQIVCVALAAPGVEVGVDVEQRRVVDWSMLRRSVFEDEEWASTERSDDPGRRRMDAWARKESAVKASGHGLSLPLRDVVTVETQSGWVTELPRAAGFVAGTDLTLTADVAAAVAIYGEALPPPISALAVHQTSLT